MGSFKNHVDKIEWVGGHPKVHICPHEVGMYSYVSTGLAEPIGQVGQLPYQFL